MSPVGRWYGHDSCSLPMGPTGRVPSHVLIQPYKRLQLNKLNPNFNLLLTVSFYVLVSSIFLLFYKVFSKLFPVWFVRWRLRGPPFTAFTCFTNVQDSSNNKHTTCRISRRKGLRLATWITLQLLQLFRENAICN